MKQNKKSTIFDSRIFMMILSLLASLALWAYISGQETTSITKTLSGVQVQFSGENTLREEHVVVDLKSEIEKIREQIQNIE